MNIYLDIDGVLLANDKMVANGAKEFLEFVTENHNCYWLTTHCRDGNPDWAVEYVNKIAGIDTEILKKIKPCRPWATFKTEAINFDTPFLWLDDDLFEGERRALKEHNALDNMEYIDLAHDPDQLIKITKELQNVKIMHMSHALSYLMGAEEIKDSELKSLGIEIKNTTKDGDRMLVIPAEKLSSYIELVKSKLTNGFWNEIIGEKEITFIFKFKNGHTKEYKLSPENEQEIDALCAKFNNEPPDKTANVYKYISDNNFYHDFMMKHYADLINRKLEK